MANDHQADNHSVEPSPDIQEDIKTATQGKRAGWIIIAIVVTFAAVAWFVWWRPKSNNPNNDTAESIRQAFTPPQTGTSTLTFVPPNSTQSPAPQVPVTTAVPPPPVIQSPSAGQSKPVENKNNPRGNSSAYRRPAPPTPHIAGATVYHNSGLGFEFTLPAGWATYAQENGNHVIFFYQSGQQAGYIEAYNNFNNITLDDLQATLQRSADISQIGSAAVNGIPALQFSSAEGEGIALIANNMIYYLRGALVNQINRVKFF